MQIIPRINGLKSLQKTFDRLTRPGFFVEAENRTRAEIARLETRPSLRLVNHVYGGILRDILRRSRR